MGRKPDLKKRRHILEEAEHLIHLRGYHATAMEDIARSCGMTKANLFHHYGSKEELGLAVLDAKVSDYRQRNVDPLCSCEDPVEGVGELFKQAARLFGGNGCKAGCLIGNIALEMSDVNEQFRERAGRFFGEWAARMARCLARAKAAGAFGPSLEPAAAADAIISLYEGAIMLARARRDPSVFLRVGRMAKSLLSQHRIRNTRRNATMGPKTPCGC